MNWTNATAAAQRAWNASTGTNTTDAARRLRWACADRDALAARSAISFATGAAQTSGKWHGEFQQAILDCEEALRASTPELKRPTIHLNGTSQESLLNQVCEAASAGRKFQDALQEMSPNGRDYYPQGPDALSEANKQHRARMTKVQEIMSELAQLADYIAERR